MSSAEERALIDELMKEKAKLEKKLELIANKLRPLINSR